VSDFGRDAALAYMRMVADDERRLIQNVLERHSLPFFDEYRRLMFTLLGDLGYYKRPSVEATISRDGYLTQSVLIGFGDPGMTKIVYRRIAIAVVQALIAAAERGYTRLRVAIPCNRLSDCASYLGDLLASPDELDHLNREFDNAIPSWRALQHVTITTHPLVDAVVRHVQNVRALPKRVLVLAAPEVLVMYELAFTRAGIEIVDAPTDHQGLVNRLVLASIAHDQREIAGIRSELVAVTDQIGDDVVVIEACTDFDVNVGISSLAVYANTMVRDYYSRELGLV